METFLQILYSYLVYPFILVVFHLAAIFKKDIRKALAGRYKYRSLLKRGMKGKSEKDAIVLLHASSMGEFEHVKPLITQLKSKYKIETVVTFFSPSGYENVKEFPGVRFFFYLPFDFPFIWKKTLKLLRPKALIISKHDVWPNQVRSAQKQQIPTYLINASLSENSSRINPLIRFFQKQVYRSLTGIYTIGEEDARRFRQNFPRCAIEVKGDTKFDQVLLRKKQAAQKEILPKHWLKDNFILLFGSVWPEDLKYIYPALDKVLAEEKKIKVIVVPHQPEKGMIQTMARRTARHGNTLYSEAIRDTSKILIVNAVGVLADLYKYAHLAYVGGSFKQGIHNVMEPAIYEIPVLYGPVHKNASEAIALNDAKGSIVVSNETELTEAITKMIRDHSFCEQMGKRAGQFARRHTGGTERILEDWVSRKIIRATTR